MADKGIIFSAPMVYALLAGTKTQTRRLLTSARVFGTPHTPAFTLRGETLTRALQGADRFRHLGGDGWLWEADAFEWQALAERTGWMAHIGYAPGDRLYVREACAIDGRRVWYRLDHEEAPARGPRVDVRWRPSIHMPRSASRLWLAVTEVRVQRLRAISVEDVLAEGAPIDPNHWDTTQDGSNPIMCIGEHPWTAQSPHAWYHRLWDNLHTEPGTRWDDNPWIYATTFEVHHGNIDAEGRNA